MHTNTSKAIIGMYSVVMLKIIDVKSEIMLMHIKRLNNIFEMAYNFNFMDSHKAIRTDAEIWCYGVLNI